MFQADFSGPAQTAALTATQGAFQERFYSVPEAITETSKTEKYPCFLQSCHYLRLVYISGTRIINKSVFSKF